MGAEGDRTKKAPGGENSSLLQAEGPDSSKQPKGLPVEPPGKNSEDKRVSKEWATGRGGASYKTREVN